MLCNFKLKIFHRIVPTTFPNITRSSKCIAIIYFKKYVEFISIHIGIHQWMRYIVCYFRAGERPAVLLHTCSGLPPPPPAARPQHDAAGPRQHRLAAALDAARPHHGLGAGGAGRWPPRNAGGCAIVSRCGYNRASRPVRPGLRRRVLLQCLVQHGSCLDEISLRLISALLLHMSEENEGIQSQSNFCCFCNKVNICNRSSFLVNDKNFRISHTIDQ